MTSHENGLTQTLFNQGRDVQHLISIFRFHAVILHYLNKLISYLYFVFFSNINKRMENTLLMVKIE